MEDEELTSRNDTLGMMWAIASSATKGCRNSGGVGEMQQSVIAQGNIEDQLLA